MPNQETVSLIEKVAEAYQARTDAMEKPLSLEEVVQLELNDTVYETVSTADDELTSMYLRLYPFVQLRGEKLRKLQKLMISDPGDNARGLGIEIAQTRYPNDPETAETILRISIYKAVVAEFRPYELDLVIEQLKSQGASEMQIDYLRRSAHEGKVMMAVEPQTGEMIPLKTEKPDDPPTTLRNTINALSEEFCTSSLQNLRKDTFDSLGNNEERRQYLRELFQSKLLPFRDIPNTLAQNNDVVRGQ